MPTTPSPLDALRWFRRDGDGPTRVLLHGFTGAPASWEAVAARLRGPVVALALPGHHPTAAVAGGFTANVDAVADRLRDAGCAGCHLIGYSLGARTALGLAARHAALLSRVTLIGVHPGLADEQARRERRRADASWAALLRTEGVAAFVAAWEALPLFRRQQVLGAAPLARQRAIRLAHDAEGLARSLEEMGLGAMPDHRAAFATLPMPIDVIAGTADDAFVAHARALAASRAGVAVALLERCGHNPLLEAPEALASRL